MWSFLDAVFVRVLVGYWELHIVEKVAGACMLCAREFVIVSAEADCSWPWSEFSEVAFDR